MICQLHVEEGKIRPLPGPPPVGDQGPEEAGIESRLLGIGMAFPMIEDDSLDGESRERSHHAVEEKRWTIEIIFSRVAFRQGRRQWRGASRGSRRLNRLFIGSLPRFDPRGIPVTEMISLLQLRA